MQDEGELSWKISSEFKEISFWAMNSYDIIQLKNTDTGREVNKMRHKNIVTGEIVDEQILICDYNDDFKLEEPDISYEMYLELNGWKLVE